MRKINKFLLLFSIILLFVCGTCGCQDNKTSIKSVKGNDCEVLNGFNSYNEIKAKYFGNHFGKAEVNTDKNYISEGNGSLHVLIQGDYASKNSYPFVRYDLQSEAFGNSDFSNYSNITLDVYNATDKDLLFNFWFVALIDSVGLDTPIKSYQIKANQWNTLNYDLSDGSIKKKFGNLKSISELVIQFPNYKQSEDEQCNSIYIDNFCGVKGDCHEYNPNRADNEILFFESSGDCNLFESNLYFRKGYYNPRITQNFNKKYISQGSASMRIDFDVVEYSEDLIGADYYSPYVKFNVNDIAKLNKSITGIALDVFNGNYSAERFTIQYVIEGRTYSKEYGIGGNEKLTVNINHELIAKISEISFVHIPVKNYDNSYLKTFYLDNIRWIQ